MTGPYHVTYAFAQHPEGKAKKDIPDGWGACDAFLFASVVRTVGDGLDVQLISGDGKTGERLRPADVASIAGALMLDCAQDSGLEDEVRHIFNEAFEKLQDFVTRSRKETAH